MKLCTYSFQLFQLAQYSTITISYIFRYIKKVHVKLYEVSRGKLSTVIKQIIVQGD